MDIEFHYYITYLIAARAGFGPEDAFIIAYSSQYTDDNDIIFTVDKEKPTVYKNYISQTLNILKPKRKLFRIYPVFHFIPGYPMAKSAYRKDGKMHWLNTTPNSKNAKKIMNAALYSNDLYRIGLACHGYADSWAHQNFVGYYDAFNSMSDPLSFLKPNIGHVEALHNPDLIALVWEDKRLLHERVSNVDRFLKAATYLLTKLTRYVDPKIKEKYLQKIKISLRKNLKKAIGEYDHINILKEGRIARYKALSETNDYGDKLLADYCENKWFEEAVDERVRGLRDRSNSEGALRTVFTDIYNWKNPKQYKQSHWYRFQEAVKQHQQETLDILMKTNLKGLELPEF